MLGTVLGAGDTVVNKTIKNLNLFTFCRGSDINIAVCHVVMVGMEITKADERVTF